MNASRARGLLFALGAVYAGAAVWVALAEAAHAVRALTCVGIGAFVALAYAVGARVVDASGRVIAAVLSVLAIALGDAVFATGSASLESSWIGFDVTFVFAGLMGRFTANPLDAILVVLCGAGGAWVVASVLRTPRLAAMIEPPGVGGSRPAS